MFDIGWTELLVLAVIAILIVGPKELPRMLYSIGQTVGKMRRQADDFRRQFNESMREAGMDEVRNDMKKMSDLNPANQIRNEIESTFTDNPKPGSGQTGPSSASGETGAGHRSEGDLLAQTESASNAESPAGSEAPNQPAETASTETASSDDERRGGPKPVGNRNANGAAEAKDAVS
jgi:sec-independent protein translocase protein TatB